MSREKQPRRGRPDGGPGRPKPGELFELVRRCDPTAVLAAAGRCDGHTIFDPKAFLDAGLPAEVVQRLTATYRSDGTPKGTIFVAGRAVDELAGVYGLDVLRFLAAALGVEYPSAFGRRTEARNIQAALAQRLRPAAKSPPPNGGAADPA